MGWKGRTYEAIGSGRQKAHAQSVAAQDILNQIKAANQMPQEDNKPLKNVNSRMLINERRMVKGGVIAYGEATPDTGTPILWTLTATYTEVGVIYTAPGTASSIKAAQDKAVGAILEQLPALEDQTELEN